MDGEKILMVNWVSVIHSSDFLLSNFRFSGDGTKIHKWAPTQLETNGIEIGKIVQVALGSGHALALSSNNKLFAWGSNVSGQLG